MAIMCHCKLQHLVLYKNTIYSTLPVLFKTRAGRILKWNKAYIYIPNVEKFPYTSCICIFPKRTFCVMCNCLRTVLENVGFEVFTALIMKNAILWDVAEWRCCVNTRPKRFHIPEEGILLF